MLRGPVGFDIDSESELQTFRHAMVALRGKVSDHEFLHSPDGHGRRSWRVAARYVITLDPDQPWTMPIWLTPSIVPGSDRRVLDLDFQWAKFGPGKNGLALGAIEKLRIDVPDEWGPVLGSTKYTLVSISSSEEAGCRVIEWRPIPDVPHTARGRYRISLRFEERIRPEDAIRGEMVARFRGNLCRVEHMDLHGPDGERRDRMTTKRHTRARLEFDLSLAAVDYEAVRVLERPPRGRSGFAQPRRASPPPVGGWPPAVWPTRPDTGSARRARWGRPSGRSWLGCSTSRDRSASQLSQSTLALR